MAKINDLCRGAGLAELILRNVTDKFADKDFDGAPVRIKESKQDDKLSEEIITGILTSYRSLDFFLQTWNDAEKKLAENVRKRNYWTKYGDKARNILNAILDKYAETGIEAIEDMKVLTVPPITDIGKPKEIIDSFGGKPQYLQAIRELEAEIYSAA